MIWLAFILGAYLLGSIPVGLVIGRWRGIDVRKHGSGNIGATNVGRVLGRRAGLLCFALDFLKGCLPVLIAGAAFDLLGRWSHELTSIDLWLWLAVVAAAVLGHVASIFLGFRGGKGVSTAFGTLLACWPLLGIPALIAIVIWVMAAIVWRYASLASIVSGVSLPVSVFIMIILRQTHSTIIEKLAHGAPLVILTALLAIMVVQRHWSNMKRIRAGTEPRIGLSMNRTEALRR